MLTVTGMPSHLFFLRACLVDKSTFLFCVYLIILKKNMSRVVTIIAGNHLQILPVPLRLWLNSMVITLKYYDVHTVWFTPSCFRSLHVICVCPFSLVGVESWIQAAISFFPVGHQYNCFFSHRGDLSDVSYGQENHSFTFLI